VKYMTNNALKITSDPHIRVGVMTRLELEDLENLCLATRQAIEDGIGFNWITAPLPEVLESYWRGVMIVPERILIGAWLDGVLCGSVQLVKPSRSKETSYFCAHVEAHFVAPWARGHGIARRLLEQVEREASHAGFTVLRLSVRETQAAAIQLYREQHYLEWGVLPCHEIVGGQMIAGHYFYKNLPHASSIE
jgi:ribosomal protein S18 acetylase RimI-like enzyme